MAAQVLGSSRRLVYIDALVRLECLTHLGSGEMMQGFSGEENKRLPLDS